MREIGDTAFGLKTALRDYIGITFNEKLMDSLDNLEKTMKQVSKALLAYTQTKELTNICSQSTTSNLVRNSAPYV